jgi:ubiquitin C-terminal hydrolase
MLEMETNVKTKMLNCFSEYSSLNDDEEINNEADLIRDNPVKPCGLKNVGNTCWFNSIIQVF